MRFGPLISAGVLMGMGMGGFVDGIVTTLRRHKVAFKLASLPSRELVDRRRSQSPR